MCKQPQPLFCRFCDRSIHALDILMPDPEGPNLCPHCKSELVPLSSLFANPLTIDLGLRILGFIARTIINAGILDRLDEMAEKTETPVDNIALRLARVVIQEAAKL